MKTFMTSVKAAAVLAGACGFTWVESALAQGVDLIVGDISSSSAYVLAGSPKAYSLGIALCNLGSMPASFDSVTAAHPVVTQNLYRLSNGRFEQIGQAWVQHLSSTVEQNLCSTCTPTGDITKLGAGCSTTDSASAMGLQSTFGAKSEVNAAAETFVWPRVNMGTGSGAAFKRLQADIADLPPGPLYFVSAMVVSAEDRAAGNELNNESYRRVTVGFAGTSLPLSVADTTQRGVPAVQAWRDQDPGVMLTAVDVPGDGRFWIASKATDLGGGVWHYEYAVQNLTSGRAAGSFIVPLRSGQATNVASHQVLYHSGEPYSNTEWFGVADGPSGAGVVRWTTPEPYSQNPNTSALRWDTVYNFRFDSNARPETGSAVLGLFVPGTPTSVSGAVIIPGSACGSADFNCDGDVGTDADIEAFFACVAGSCPLPPCLSSADFNGDGDVGTDLDIEVFFQVLGGGAC
jgi:hypothetical protein